MTLLTAEFDPLRDEGEAYAEKLKQAGNDMVVKRYPGLVHGFISMSDILEDSAAALDLLAGQLRKAFS